jgi:hypothetical protein
MPRQKKAKAQPSLTGLPPLPLKGARKADAAEIFPKVEAEIAFIEPPAPEEASIPEQKEHFQLPTRFGAVPVDEAPLGWEVETRRHEVKVTKFQHAYPTIRLPFQEVQRMEFGHNDQFTPLPAGDISPEAKRSGEGQEVRASRKYRELFPTGANRLFFGDNLHIMRQLPSESIDLIYIDPPFFSGRNYNVIFGDKNEVRSFSDIWEGGMPGYLVWLNARLWEMKRLLKSTGSIFVHLDWHASHYVKVEMDKIFAYNSFRNEIIWYYYNNWGIYEAPKLEQYSVEQFREFVVKAFGGRPESVSKAIHGVRYGVPLYVGEPSRKSRIGKEDVARFAKAVYEERRANHGVMLGWNFGPDARKAAEILAARENKRIDFVRLSLIRLEEDEFREHVVTKHKDYGPLLSFIQPPEVRVAVRRVKALNYEFDVSESVSLNKDGAIANVQWDFDYKAGRFTSTQGYSFMRDKKTGCPLLVVEYEFPDKGEYTIACSVQDDQGGERTWCRLWK